MSRSRPMAPLALAAVLALILAACGGEDGATTEPPDTTQVPPAATDPIGDGDETDAPAGDGGEETVTISGFSFGGDLTVAAGTAVTFVNEDAAAHTVTEGVDGAAADGARFDDDVAGGGASTTIRFDEPGEYQITCRFHPTMNMTVNVEG